MHFPGDARLIAKILPAIHSLDSALRASTLRFGDAWVNGGMAAMMGGMGLVWLLVIVVLVLGVAALVKYLSGR